MYIREYLHTLYWIDPLFMCIREYLHTLYWIGPLFMCIREYLHTLYWIDPGNTCILYIGLTHYLCVSGNICILYIGLAHYFNCRLNAPIPKQKFVCQLKLTSTASLQPKWWFYLNYSQKTPSMPFRSKPGSTKQNEMNLELNNQGLCFSFAFFSYDRHKIGLL